MTTTYPFIVTDEQINITIKGVPHSYADHEREYTQIVEAIKSPQNQDEAIARIGDRAASVAEYVGAVTQLQVRGNELYFGDEIVTGKLARRVMDMMAKGFPVEPLALFIENLYQNPSYRVVQKMWDFMEYGKLPVTPDGHFLAYKRVKYGTIDGKKVLVDCHSGKICNEVGQIVKMDRRKVNEDPEQTCSYGLHACSHEYLKSFSGDATVTVKINPANVVAIPVDYNHTKLRCSEYEVIEQLPETVRQKRHLSEKPVMDRFTDVVRPITEEFVNRENPEIDHDDEDGAMATTDRWHIHVGTLDVGAPHPGAIGRWNSWQQIASPALSYDSRARARHTGVYQAEKTARATGPAPFGKKYVARVYDALNRKYL